jgi:predicted transglutaminase-like cysteine proteinase
MRFIAVILLFLVVGCDEVHEAETYSGSTTLSKLREIQKEVQAYYKLDRFARSGNVTKLYQILPKGALASCSHYAALKYQLIKLHLPHEDVKIAQYYIRAKKHEEDYHAVVLVKHEKGWYVLNI